MINVPILNNPMNKFFNPGNQMNRVSNYDHVRSKIDILNNQNNRMSNSNKPLRISNLNNHLNNPLNNSNILINKVFNLNKSSNPMNRVITNFKTTTNLPNNKSEKSGLLEKLIRQDLLSTYNRIKNNR